MAQWMWVFRDPSGYVLGVSVRTFAEGGAMRALDASIILADEGGRPTRQGRGIFLALWDAVCHDEGAAGRYVEEGFVLEWLPVPRELRGHAPHS